MKRITLYLTLCLLLFNSSICSALATEIVEKPRYPSPILITEVQTGAGSAGDEFVELYNTSDLTIDITDWQVRYLNASSTSGPSLLAAIVHDDTSSPVLLQPGEYYVFHTASVGLPATAKGQVYSAKLSSAGKVVALFAPNKQTCMYEVQDALAWGESAGGEGDPFVANGSADRLIARYVGPGNYYVDRNMNTHDAMLTAVSKNLSRPAVAMDATPGMLNPQILPLEDSSPPIGEGSNLAAIGISGCTVPEPEDPDNGLEPPDEEPPSSEETVGPEPSEPSGPKIPAADIGLKSPQITELLPNPDKPLTDAADEFVELYNSNIVPFDLSGFRLEAGASTTKRRYTFPEGTTLPAKSFKAFFSAETHLSLSNAQGLVRLLDPLGNEIGTSTMYGTAKANLAWALVKGSWQWTTKPTPNAANILSKPIAKAKKATTKPTTAKASTASSGTGTVAAANTSVQEPEAETKASLHTGVLALVGGIALLYGAYEYRSDVANKLHQLRLYREARREARQSAKGR